MKEVVSLLVQWWTAGLLAIFAVVVSVYVLSLFWNSIKTMLKKCSKVPVLAIAALGVLYGGSKQIDLMSRFSHDAGVSIVIAEMNVATNETDDTTLQASWIGNETNMPISVRRSKSDQWTPIQSTGDGWSIDSYSFHGGTNSATWHVPAGVSASNVTVWAYWHLGYDLPPVELDGDGITIYGFEDTSKSVTITYSVDGSRINGSGTVTIEARRGDGVWFEAYRTSISGGVTNTVVFPGFWVGETTRWRARLEVEQ